VFEQTFYACTYVTLALPINPERFNLRPVRLWAQAFNLLVRQQPWAAQRLANHAGQTLRIRLGEFQLSFTIEHDGTLVAADSAVVPDVVLEFIAEKLPWSTLLAPGANADFAQAVHITGQAALAQVVSDLARDLRPDPEDALAQLLGDIPARRLNQGARAAVAGVHTLARSLIQNIAEYLSEESETLATTPALVTLTQGVKLTAARIDQIERQHAALQVRLARLAPSPGAAA
jgi:ubiquinone biosynthesis protein UbiJ